MIDARDHVNIDEHRHPFLKVLVVFAVMLLVLCVFFVVNRGGMWSGEEGGGVPQPVVEKKSSDSVLSDDEAQALRDIQDKLERGEITPGEASILTNELFRSIPVPVRK